MSDSSTPPNLKVALHARIDHEFSLQKPKDEVTGEKMDELRQKFIWLAHDIVDLTPVCRDQSLALTHLEDALMRGIRAIVLNQD